MLRPSTLDVLKIAVNDVQERTQCSVDADRDSLVTWVGYATGPHPNREKCMVVGGVEMPPIL